ncbi:MAG TPA: tetratricopeptide repeat protein [Thermoanaerobaculia bacterium]|nr:tetratricopeptide repeat protein [Thermoanaerobaculia bacterium]
MNESASERGHRHGPVSPFHLAIAGGLLIVAAYANFFHNGFHFDDDHVIVENASIRSLEHWTRFFTDAHTFSSLPTNATYRPLVTLSLAIDYAVHHGLDPVPFHVTQLILLLIVGVLLTVLFEDLFGREWRLHSIAASTLFCVHTANTETMNFLSSRSELLSAVGFLGALLVFIRWPEQRKRGWYLIPLAIGALAKAPVVIFAGIVIAWVRLIERRPRIAAVKAAVPSFVTGVLLLIGLNAMNAPEWIAGGGSRIAYLRTQTWVWLHYARLAVFPAGLTADSDLETFPHWYDTNVVAGTAFLLVLILAIVRLGRARDTAPIAFGLTWFAVTLLPTSSIFPLAEVANEHRLFFPLMGIAPAVVWGAELAARRWPARRTVIIGALCAVVLALAWGTHVRNRTWRTDETLWRDVTEKSPRNGRGWMNYGLTQMEQGRYDQAKAAFIRASQLTPAYSRLEINLGIVEAAMGNEAAAEPHFLRALELAPDRNAHFYYARWLLRRGRGAEALPHLAEAARLAPTWIPPRQLALRVAVARGEVFVARTLAADIASIDPTDSEAATVSLAGIDVRCGTFRRCFDRGWTATGQANHIEAAVAYRAAIAFDPRATAYNNLGWSLASLGFRNEAAASYRVALTIDPAFHNARNNLDELESAR